MVTLYGKGALVVHHGKDTYTPAGGRITVPEVLVPQLLAIGFTKDPRILDPDPVAGGASASQTDDPAAARARPGRGPDRATAVNVDRLHGALRLTAAAERLDHAVGQLAEIENLMAEGWSEAEAEEMVWLAALERPY